MNTSQITSKGTITLPVAMRQKLAMAPGDSVQIVFDPQHQQLVIKKQVSIHELRAANQLALPHSYRPVQATGGGWLAERG